MTNDLTRLIRQRSKVSSRWRKTDNVRFKIPCNNLRNLIQKKYVLENPITEIPSCRNLILFPQ